MEIDKKDIELIFDFTQNIYNSLNVLKGYCEHAQKNEETENISTILNFMHSECNKLFCNVNNIKSGIKERIN